MRPQITAPLAAALAAPLAAALAIVATPAFAQDGSIAGPGQSPRPTVDLSQDSITIGAGAVYLPDYEGSNDYRFTPAPGAIGQYKGFGFVVAGNRASIDLIPNKAGPTFDVQAGPIGVVNFNRSSLDSISDRRVKALGELGTAIELGGYVGLGKTGVITSDYDTLSVSLSYRYDVNGVHKSGIWQPSLTYLTPLSMKSAVGVFASAQHVGDKYASTYYSVSAAQSLASGLPVFNARGGWQSWTVGALGTYSLTGDLLHGFKVVGGGTYTRQLNDFATSPLVSIAGSRNQWIGTLGLAYTF